VLLFFCGQLLDIDRNALPFIDLLIKERGLIGDCSITKKGGFVGK